MRSRSSSTHPSTPGLSSTSWSRSSPRRDRHERLKDLRAAIVGLIVLATIGFVVGTTIERNSAEPHAASPAAARTEGSHAEGGESQAHRAAESGGEFQPFGVDIEAVPFIVLGAIASLGLA